MAFVENHVNPVCVGIGALGLFRLASMEGSPGKLNIVVPSVKKSTYLEPEMCTSFNAGLLLTEEACCAAEEVADEAPTVDVALSATSAAAVEVAVVEAVSVAAVLEADVERFGPMSGRPIASPASVDVALVDVAVKAATKSVLNAQKVRLVRRRLAAENAIVWVFMLLT